MKKLFTLTIALLLVLALSACGEKASSSQAASVGPALPAPTTAPAPTAIPTPTPMPYSEEDILSIFKEKMGDDLTVVDCVLADGTRDLIGVVMYLDPEDGDTQLAFVCQDGEESLCAPIGLELPPADDPALEYTSDGTVIFQLKKGKTTIGYSVRFDRNADGISFEAADLSHK